MSRTSLVLALSLLGSAVVARAGDFCILVSPPDTTKYVGKGFSVPGKGKCKSWNGMYLPSFAAVSISTGTACTSSDGTMLRINLVTSRVGVAFNDYIQLPLPDLTNGTLWEVVPQFGNGPITISGISAAKCSPEDNPIP
jgi:hypothetical protein